MPAARAPAGAENGGRSRPGLTPFEQEVVEVFVGLGQAVGLPKSYGEIYGLLFASPRPLGFSEVQERLGLSQGSVSQGLRALREIGAVIPCAGAEGSRERYLAATEMRQLVGALLRGTLQPELARGRKRLAQAGRLLEQQRLGEADQEVLSARLDKLQAWHRKAGGLLPWLAKFFG